MSPAPRHAKNEDDYWTLTKVLASALDGAACVKPGFLPSRFDAHQFSTHDAMSTRRQDCRFATLVPPLELSPSDRQRLAHEATVLVSDAVAEYRHYLSGAADWSPWRQIRSSDTIRVFRERQSITKNSSALLPEVLAIGNIAGSLDDVMYGAMASTAAATIANASIVGQRVVEAKVLCSLQRSTLHQPFDQLSVKWLLFGVGSGPRQVRDCSVIEATGVLSINTTEQVGYVLIHSVDFRNVPSLEPYYLTRAKLSTWAIYRESTPGMVQCFVKTFHDLGGSLRRSQVVTYLSDHVLSMNRFPACAQAKKFTQAMQHVDKNQTLNKRWEGDAPATCGGCSSLLSASILNEGRKRCGLCGGLVCARCVTRKTVYTANDASVAKVNVCSECSASVMSRASLTARLDELYRCATH